MGMYGVDRQQPLWVAPHSYPCTDDDDADDAIVADQSGHQFSNGKMILIFPPSSLPIIDAVRVRRSKANLGFLNPAKGKLTKLFFGLEVGVSPRRY